MSSVAAVVAGPVSLRIRMRALVVSGVLTLAVLAAMLVALAAGKNSFPLGHVVAAVSGDGTPAENLIIGELRLPRVLCAALVGIALGLAGTIFQSLTRNPLGSPDVIGFTTGASTGGLVAILVFSAGVTGTSIGAVAGGALTAAVVYALSYRHGVAPLRLVLVGLGAGLMLLSVNSVLIVRSQLYDAQSASAWLVGNLSGGDWTDVRLMLGVLAIGLVLSVGLLRPLTLGEFSDDRSISLGLHLGRMRLLAVVTGVLLASSAVAVAGPIQFIALTAPQIGRRLTGSPGPNLYVSGVTGALLLVLADLAAREAFAPRLLPVGVLTGMVGGAYLAWVLARESKRGRA